MSARRLPVYLVVDCSESMAGPAIEAVTQGLDAFIKELRCNPLALDTACLSVITFSNRAQQIIPLTELTAFHPPRLGIKPGTALGAALRLLTDCMKREVAKTTKENKGDYKPLVFILTDGQPTDEWESALPALSSPGGATPANIYAIGCGPDADIEVLSKITDIVLMMPDLEPQSIRKLFVWLSSSIETASSKIGGGGDGLSAREKLASLPAELVDAASMPNQPRSSRPRQVFLHARCSSTKKAYLLRYGYQEMLGFYNPVAAHPLEDFEESEAAQLPPINSSLLAGVPPCPYCENPGAALCPCGTIFCIPSQLAGAMTCPKCNQTLMDGGSGNFDIQHTAG